MITPGTPEAFQLMMDGSAALADVERHGIAIDVEYLDDQIELTDYKIRKLKAELTDHDVYARWQKRFGSQTDLDNRNQLGAILADELGHKLPKNANGSYSTTEEILSNIDEPLLAPWFQIQKLRKLSSTYLQGIKRECVNGRIHPFFHLHTVITYRSSSANPNFQNLPIRNPEMGKALRQAFIPYSDDYVIVEIDFGALEFRIAACLVGDTLIETIDGPQELREVVARHQAGDEVFVYSYSHEMERVCVRPVTDGALTRQKAPVFAVTLDNGEVVKATSDHNFMMRDGTYRPLRELSVGDSLMPFYTRNQKSRWGTVYQEVYLNNGERMMAHNLIALDVLDVEIAGSGLVVHHDDGVGTNNSLDNLEVMTRSLHMNIHSKQGWQNDTARRAENRRRSQSKEFRQKIRKLNIRRREEWTEEMWEVWRQKIQQTVLENGLHKGPLNGMWGKKHSEATKHKMRLKKLNKVPDSAGWNKGLTKETNESVKKISESNKGRTPWNKGRKKPPVVQQCLWCGGDFELEYLVDSRPRKYCSRRCGAFDREDKKKKHNHTIVSIEFAGYEDVYNITVEDTHNYALSSGIMIKNCHWKDPNMIEYASDSTLDVHRDMAMECYLLDKDQVTKMTRSIAKNSFVFPILYGSYYVSCADALWNAIDLHELATVDGVRLHEHLRTKGISTQKQFEQHIKKVEERFNRKFPTWSERKEEWWNLYCERGWFPMMTGFVCNGVYSRNNLMNTPIQGPAFHCLLKCLILLNDWTKKQSMQSKVSGQIHDSLYSNVHRNELDDFLAKAQHIMTVEIRELWDWVLTPLEVEIEIAEDNWYNKKEFVFEG